MLLALERLARVWQAARPAKADGVVWVQDSPVSRVPCTGPKTKAELPSKVRLLMFSFNESFDGH